MVKLSQLNWGGLFMLLACSGERLLVNLMECMVASYLARLTLVVLGWSIVAFLM